MVALAGFLAAWLRYLRPAALGDLFGDHALLRDRLSDNADAVAQVEGGDAARIRVAEEA